MDPDRERTPLLDYRRLGGQLGGAALLLGALAFLGTVVAGLNRGLSFGLMGRWLAVYVLALFVAAVALTAVHALKGMSRAQGRGERLGSSDVGLLPPRRRNEPAD